MSYDIEGWEYNEGSGSSDWLNEVMNAGANVANYLPEGYANPTWDKSEHYSYEPGVNSEGDNLSFNSDNNGSNVISLGSGYGGGGGGGGGGFTVGSQWGSGGESQRSSSPSQSLSSGRQPSSGSNYVSGGGQFTDNWINDVVTTAMKATKTMPAYSAPAWNKDRVKSLTQRNFGTTANQLGNKVNEAITRSFSMDNPLLQKEYMRGTLRGYGEGLGTAQDSARKAAVSEYSQEYASDVDAAKTTYEAALKDYFGTMEQTTTKTKEYADIPRSAVPATAVLTTDSDGNTWWGAHKVIGDTGTGSSGSSLQISRLLS